MKFGGMLCDTEWPKYDIAKTVEDTIEIPIQINGKLRAKVVVNKDAGTDEMKEAVRKNTIVIEAMQGKTIVKGIYVPGRVYNIVLK